MIFNWCNKTTTDGLFNVFEFDSMAYNKLLPQKSLKTFIEMPIGSNFENRKW